MSSPEGEKEEERFRNTFYKWKDHSLYNRYEAVLLPACWNL
jgi:hypothetical protein